MLSFPRIAAVLLLAVALAGCEVNTNMQTFSQGHLISAYTAEDGRQIFELLLSEPSFKEVADKVAPLTLRAEITIQRTVSDDLGIGGKTIHRVQTFDYDYADGKVTIVQADAPDFTLRTTESLTLNVLNANDGLRVFTCALRDNAATIESTNAAYAASFNAAKKRIVASATDCEAKVGDQVTWKGLHGVLFVPPSPHEEGLFSARMGGEDGDYLTFDKYRAPVGWRPAAHNLCAAADCTGAGYSARSSDIAACALEVEKAYAEDPGESDWEAGLKVAPALKKAAELTACKLVQGAF